MKKLYFAKNLLHEIMNYLERDLQTIKEAGRIALMAVTAMLIVPAVASTQTMTNESVIADVTPIETTQTSVEIQTVASWHDIQIAHIEIQGENIASISGDYEEAEAFTEEQTEETIPTVVAELAHEKPFSFDPTLPFGYSVAREVVAEVSGYNPLPEQTDSTPCITASGKNICEGEHAVVAANWLKFGTKVMIPEYFGDTVFTVEDRMNPRYPYNVDVLFYDKGEARQLGRRKLLVQVLEESDVQIASR